MSSEWITFSELLGKYGVLRKAHYLLGSKVTKQLELLRRCKERIETDLSSRGSFHRHHYEELLDELAEELGDDG